jgi:uncharacterized membrane protein
MEQFFLEVSDEALLLIRGQVFIASRKRDWNEGAQPMRQKNWRIVIVGSVLLFFALAFFLFFLSIASESTDPAALMRIVGTVAGVLGGLGIVMILLGMIGKKP